jgi:hypothetical protein
MAVATQAALVAQRARQGLAQRDADILNRVVGIDVQVTTGSDVEVDQPVARDLLEHVVKEGHAGGETAAPAAIEIQPDIDPGFERVPGDFCLPHRDTIA